MLTVFGVMNIQAFEAKLPRLSKEDRDRVVGNRVVLETAGIPGDGAKEKGYLEGILLDFGWHLAYVRYVENCVEHHVVPCLFNEWKKIQGP